MATTSRKTNTTPGHLPQPPITYGTPRVGVNGFAVYLDISASASVGYRAVNAALLRISAACEDLAQIRDAWVVSHGYGDSDTCGWVKLKLCHGDSVDRAKECLTAATRGITSLRPA